MIKRIELVTRREAQAVADFCGAWQERLARHARAPEDVRPTRIALCFVLDDDTWKSRHDGVVVEWFSDVHHFGRFDAWSSADTSTPRGHLPDREPSRVVVARETVGRGADWLEDRWRQGGARFKHMALARRAGHLTPEEFSRQWQSRAGMLGRPGEMGSVDIPEDVKGRAYVQNHPLPRAEGEWAYDAINEVYFDDREALERRVEWFAENLEDRRVEGDLFSDRAFLCVSEEILLGSR